MEGSEAHSLKKKDIEQAGTEMLNNGSQLMLIRGLITSISIERDVWLDRVPSKINKNKKCKKFHLSTKNHPHREEFNLNDVQNSQLNITHPSLTTRKQSAHSTCHQIACAGFAACQVPSGGPLAAGAFIEAPAGPRASSIGSETKTLFLTQSSY